MVRRLVEQDEVLLLFGTLGTPTKTAIHKCVNVKKIPHLVLATGASKFTDPEHFAWAMSSLPTYSLEAKVRAKHIQATMPEAWISVLVADDDFGRTSSKDSKKGSAIERTCRGLSESSEPPEPTQANCCANCSPEATVDVHRTVLPERLLPSCDRASEHLSTLVPRWVSGEEWRFPAYVRSDWAASRLWLCSAEMQSSGTP